MLHIVGKDKHGREVIEPASLVRKRPHGPQNCLTVIHSL
jgi:hypothetical protein